MKSLAQDIAAALVRAWTRVYTAWMDPAVRDARRAEIDSDLWEQRRAEDADPWLAMRMVGRLLLGIPDDLRWRLEAARGPSGRRRTALAFIAASTMLIGLWIGSITTASIEIPPPLEVRWERAPRTPPPPPPPPPPLCEPPGLGRAPVVPCTPWPRGS